MEINTIIILVALAGLGVIITLVTRRQNNNSESDQRNELTANLALKEQEIRAFLSENGQLAQALEDAQERNMLLQRQLEQQVSRYDESIQQRQLSEQKVVVLTHSLESANAKNQELVATIDQLTQTNTSLDNIRRDNEKLIAQLQANNQTLNERLESQKQEVEQLQKQMKTEFENVANRLLEEKSKKFTEQNTKSVDQLIKPLEQSLAEFKQQINKNLTEETKQRSSLEEQMKQMVVQSSKITAQANNLATALKGKSKIRGNWGELILETVLQNSGLQQGREYELEKSFVDQESGKRQRPDALIFLPNKRTIVVDSKVSLVAYDLYCSSEDEAIQQEAIKNHISSIKGHIDTLAQKRYDKIKEANDFTIMFVPIEPAYMLAIEKDGSLWNYAYERRIMLISPSNLLPCLKLINDVWYRENQSLNSQKIVERGERLYEKCVAFADSMGRVGEAIGKSQAEFDKAQKLLSTGNGSIFSQTRMLRGLGLKSSKELPDWQGSSED
ncbi:MAG: DNA recombination protein RmuC [Rikenellaceae bacterium]